MKKNKELLKAQKAFSVRILGVLLLFLGLALPNVVKADTETCTPGSVGDCSGTYSGQNNVVGKSSSNTSSSATVSASSNNSTSYVSYKFALSEIPENATNIKVACTARAGRSTDRNITSTVALYSGTSSKTSSNITSTGNTGGTITMSETSWTYSDLQNLQLRFSVTKTGGKSDRSISVYGADLTVTYEIDNTFKINVETLTGGSITAKVNNTTVTSAAENATVTLSNNPNDGYQFVSNSYTVDGVAITGNTFTMPNHAVTVSASFAKKPTFTIELTQAVGGTVSVSETSAYQGKTITLTSSTNSGYEFDFYIVKDADGKSVSVTYNGTVGTFSMPASNVTVSGKFGKGTRQFALVSGAVDPTKKYLIVYQESLNADNGIMMKSDFTKYYVDKPNVGWVTGTQGTEVSIDNNTITTYSTNAFTLTESGDGYSIMSNSKYLLGTRSSEDTRYGNPWFAIAKENDMENNNDYVIDYVNTIEFGRFGNAIIQVPSSYSKDNGPLQYDHNSVGNNRNQFFYGGWNTYDGLIYLYEEVTDKEVTAYHSVNIVSNDCGIVSANKYNAKPGEVITLSVFPEAGFTFDRLVVPEGVTLTKSGDDYTFIMPNQSVEISSLWINKPMVVSSYGWSTFYFKKAFKMPDGVTGVIVEGRGNEGVDFSLVFNYKYPSGSIVPARTPILIRGTVGSHEFELSEDSGDSPETNYLRGILRHGWIVREETAQNTHYYYKLTTGPDADGNTVLGFFWGDDNGDVFEIKNDTRAYLVVSQSAGAKSMKFDFNGEPNGIQSVDANPNTNANSTYNLAGQRVGENYRGLVIKNGRKYIAQ